MGQILHGSARTTAAVRRAIQHSQESLKALSERHGINEKTVSKWKKRNFVHDERMGPKQPRSTVLTPEEAAVVAFRRYTLLPLDDCLYALQPTIPHLTRSNLHVACNGTASRLPEVEGDKPAKKKFKNTRSATSISTSPRFRRKKESYICSSPSTARQSLLMRNCMNGHALDR
jgi:hypothetical protein